jgi:hypothetical protein
MRKRNNTREREFVLTSAFLNPGMIGACSTAEKSFAPRVGLRRRSIVPRDFRHSSQNWKSRATVIIRVTSSNSGCPAMANKRNGPSSAQEVAQRLERDGSLPEGDEVGRIELPSTVEIRQPEPLVRGVYAAAGQPKSDCDGLDAELSLEDFGDRHGTA